MIKWLKWFFTAQITEQQKIKLLPYIFIAMLLAPLLGAWLSVNTTWFK